jgi:predicted acyl esterase
MRLTAPTDCRGTWKSGGDVNMPCSQEGQDNYDVIEWLAEQPWCNGKVTMCGNSYLAMTQWFTGAEDPPHLACLAPWEGISDLYNDMVRRGGIPNPGFADGMFRGDIATLAGSRADDITSIIYENPTWNAYWQDHRAKFENIRCPMYIVSSWTNLLHVSGTFRGWEKSVNSERWLRIHGSHEWPGSYPQT